MKDQSRFLTPLIIQDIDGEHSTLFEDLYFYSVRHNGVFIAPHGFVTDFATIPRWVWTVIPKRGKHDWPAVMHDAAYQAKLLNENGDKVHLIKPLADLLFKDGLISRGVSDVTTNIMYSAVCKFGGSRYHGLGV